MGTYDSILSGVNFPKWSLEDPWIESLSIQGQVARGKLTDGKSWDVGGKEVDYRDRLYVLKA
jgi:hypothetical protein